VHGAIDFHRKAKLRAVEVDNIGIDSVLPPEFKTIEAPIAQTTPKQLL
jgi:hypothetical protein